MVKKDKTKEYIKNNPEIFDVNKNTVSHYISEEEIPDISWFYEKNRDIIPDKKTCLKNKKAFYMSKKFIIPVCAVLILAVFFGATPIGRVMADAIYRTVVQYFSGEVNMKHGKGDMESQTETANKSTYHSIEEARLNYSGEIAYSKEVTLEKIEIEAMDVVTVISSTYTTPGKHTLNLTQTITKEETEWASSIHPSDGQALNQKLKDGTEINGYINENAAYAIAYKDNMSIKLYSDAITYEEFMRFLKSIEIE